MFSASSPSISPPSNRSPGDSGRDPRMVLEDDRRREHRVVADEHRPRADVLAARRLRRRHEAPADEQRVRRAQRVPQRLLADRSPTHGVVLRIVTVSRGPSTSTSTTPASAVERERPRPDRALDALLQEAHRDLDVVRVALQQHLRAHQTRVVRVQRGPGGREDAAERPPALVLQRRAAVRPQHVALVHDRVRERAQVAHSPSALQRVVPGRERVARLVGRQPVEALLAQPHPRRAAEVALHRLLPHPHRQPVFRLAVPRQPRGLQLPSPPCRRRCR